MSPHAIAYVLTALAAVVIVLTRVRLGKDRAQAAGRLDIPSGLVNAHTVAGVLALVTWVYFLLRGTPDLVGLVALVLWWVTAVVGLLILARWMPARGRHASGPASDSWGEGPGLSILGHVGLVVGSVVWTAFYLLGKV